MPFLNAPSSCHRSGDCICSASAATSTTRLNGWYPCSEYTFAEDGKSSGQNAECAIYHAPLCHPRICETPESVNSMVDIFVKRLPATTNADTASNVWLMPGGPGQASDSMENMMLTLHSRLNGTVNVYTMDHRGTGRSTFLDCVAAHACATGSPYSNDIDPIEVASCAQALEFKYGTLAAFSKTSAATDMKTFLSEHSNGASTIVYGVSYGTALVERLMHLNPPNVTGYVLDGISTTMSASTDTFEYFSKWETDFGEVGDYFLGLCAQDSACSAHFTQKTLSTTLQDLLTRNQYLGQFETIFQVARSARDHSYQSKKAQHDSSDRLPIEPLRVQGHREFEAFFNVLTNDHNYKSKSDIFYYFNLLFYLIAFSEMWEIPGPSVAEMEARFASTRLSDGSMYPITPLYCAFSKEKSPACDELGLGNYDASPIIYERDHYWNKSVTIPSDASVLLLSSKLDVKTPHKHAEYLLDILQGDNKELITFNYTVHGSVTWTFLVDNDYTSPTCGMELFASYVKNGGDLNRVDKSCVAKMPPFNMTVPVDYQYIYLSTEDVYDGEYNSSLRSLYE